MSLSGTRMATAVASGVIALMVEANRATGGPGAPDLTPNAVKAVLHYTATAVRDDHGVEYDPLTRGAGALNGEGAVRYARAIDTRSPEGSPWLVPSLAPVNPYTVIADEQLPWGAGRRLGQRVCLGNGRINHGDGCWGPVVGGGCLGSNTSSGTTRWGSAVVWGSDSSASATARRSSGAAPTASTASRRLGQHSERRRRRDLRTVGPDLRSNSTLTRTNPIAGAVATGLRSIREASAAATPSIDRRPSPTSTSVPAIARTMWRRNPSPAIVSVTRSASNST